MKKHESKPERKIRTNLKHTKSNARFVALTDPNFSQMNNYFPKKNLQRSNRTLKKSPCHSKIQG